MLLSKTVQFFACISILYFMATIGCDKGTEPSGFELMGITRTDTSGNIIEDDPDDWQPRLMSIGGFPIQFGVKPAYPNPAGKDLATFGGDAPRLACSFSYALPNLATVHITITDSPNRVVRTLADGSAQTTGYYQYFWNLQDGSEQPVQNGIYRVFITAITEDTTYQSHGDIEIQR